MQLPQIGVDADLYQALALIAASEERSLSDVERSFLRMKEDKSEMRRLPPIRVEAPLVSSLQKLADSEGRAVSDVMRSRLRAGIKKYEGA